MDRLVSIPERVSIMFKYMMRGRKPPSLATEVSIPERVLRANKYLSLLPSKLHDTG